MSLFQVISPAASSDPAWSRVLLSTASGTLDTNSKLVGSITETPGNGGTTSVTIDADGLSPASTPGDGAIWYWQMDALYSISWENIFSMDFVLEIVTATSDASKMIAWAGLSSNVSSAANINTYFVGGGYEHGTTTSPRPYVRSAATTTIGTADINNTHTLTSITSPADVISHGVYCYHLNSSFQSNITVSPAETNTSPAAPSDAVYIVLGLDHTATAAADYTFEFRLWNSPVAALNK